MVSTGVGGCHGGQALAGRATALNLHTCPRGGNEPLHLGPTHRRPLSPHPAPSPSCPDACRAHPQGKADRPPPRGACLGPSSSLEAFFEVSGPRQASHRPSSSAQRGGLGLRLDFLRGTGSPPQGEGGVRGRGPPGADPRPHEAPTLPRSHPTRCRSHARAHPRQQLALWGSGDPETSWNKNPFFLTSGWHFETFPPL